MKELNLTRRTMAGALLAGVTLAALPAMAQEWPKKQPLKIVVGANAGGVTDSLARITAEFLQKRLGQAVVVENRPGAGGSIGADYVAKAPADGYTLLLMANEFVALPAVRNNLPYKFDEFTFLTRGFTVQPMIYASSKLPVSSATELVSYMKANPGKVRYGTTGIGGVLHLGIASFEGATGVKGVHIPYTGAAPMYMDMLAGNIELTQGTPPSPEGSKVVAVVGTKRSAVFPNVPTLEESGIKNASWDAWFGFMAPPKLPSAIADRLNAEIGAVLKDPEAIAKYTAAAKFGPEVNPLIGEDFKKRAVAENKNWKVVVDREKIVVQQ